jgi:hypothetical protein
MKTSHFILVIPLLAFLSCAIILAFGKLLILYPRYDLTPYLMARSLACDWDLAYTRVDSDRFFKENLRRPSHFLVTKKDIVDSSGGNRSFFVFYNPSLYSFYLAPFAGLFLFRGFLLSQMFLIGTLYVTGYIYYRTAEEDSVLPALNSVVYLSLVPLPILFLLPSSHLFLFTTCFCAVFFGLRKRMLISAIFLAIAFSVQPWSILIGLILISYWQYSGLKSEPVRFLLYSVLSILTVSCIEYLMYPERGVPDVRLVSAPQDQALASIWQTLPAISVRYFAAADLQRVSDFLFGRTIGLFVYGFTGFALVLSCIWFWSDRLVSRIFGFFVLCLIAIAISDPSSWNIQAFVNDWWILLCSVAFFIAPLIRPLSLFALIGGFSVLLTGPLLANPAGALINRNYYLQVLPYRLFPNELSLLGKIGITSDPPYHLDFPQGRIYFLDDSFYPESDFFWVKGEHDLEFILQVPRKNSATFLKIQNASIENTITVLLGGKRRVLRMTSLETVFIDLDQYSSSMKEYQGRYVLHGRIKSSSGVVPKLLSRDSLDYRYLGCQVQFIPKQASTTPSSLAYYK